MKYLELLTLKAQHSVILSLDTFFNALLFAKGYLCCNGTSGLDPASTIPSGSPTILAVPVQTGVHS
jgi:hypothetical protein